MNYSYICFNATYPNYIGAGVTTYVNTISNPTTPTNVSLSALTLIGTNYYAQNGTLTANNTNITITGLAAAITASTTWTIFNQNTVFMNILIQGNLSTSNVFSAILFTA